MDAWRTRRAQNRKVRDDASEVVRYIGWKAGGAVYREDPAWPLWSRYRAACNAVTPARASSWRARLANTSPSESAVSELLAEIAEVGRAAIAAAAPLRIWDTDGAPPRGLVPDPPDPGAADDADSKGGSRFTLAPGAWGP